MKLRITFFFSLLICAGVSAQNDIFFHKINVGQGLSQFSVMSVYQDEFGVIWFGTREGITRYNGTSTEILYPRFDQPNALPENLIFHICGNRDGEVYVHSQNGVTVYDLRSESFATVTRSNVDAISFGSDRLWITEGNRIYTFRGGEKKLHAILEESHSSISCIMQASDLRLYVGTISSGVFVIDQHKHARQIVPDCSHVSCLFEDDEKNIWIGTYGNGAYKADRKGSIVNYHTSRSGETTICSDYVRKICQDDNGTVWIGTHRGLDKLNPDREVFTHYGSDRESPLFLSNESVRSLLCDDQGTIWVGTYFGGVNYFNPDINFYKFHDLRRGDFRDTPFPIISRIVEHDDESVFLCSEGNGLIHYNLKDKSYRVFTADNRNPYSLIANNIKTAYYDRKQAKLWFGTHLGDIGGVCVLDTRTWRFEKYPTIMPEWGRANNVNALLPYGENLLVATQNGLFVLDTQRKAFSLFCEELHKTVNFILDVKTDRWQNLWIASVNGVYKYDLQERKVIRSYLYESGNPSSLSNNNAVRIFIDSRERIWIATNGGGLNLYDEMTDSFIRYDKKSRGLLNDHVSNVCESFLGRLVVSTTEGLAMIDPESGSIQNYRSETSFPLNSLYNGGMNVSSDGELFIAGMDGMVSFYEDRMAFPRKEFRLNLTRLWVNNDPVVPGDRTGILDRAMPYTDRITLKAGQRMCTIEFSSDNYIESNSVSYRYRLDGFSDAWTELRPDDHKLNFMNLRPGRYGLTVEGSLRGDQSVMDSATLQITVRPPLYNTWCAYLIYLALITLVVWKLIQFSRSKLLLKTSLDFEKKEKENLEHTNQSKLRFFTNISHEFRTPLTLIKGQIDMLLQTHEIHPAAYNRILDMQRSTFSLQKLIDELLEFRKTEQGHLRIRVSQYDLVGFMREIHLSFSEYARYKKVDFGFECMAERIEVWFDAIQLQKVFYNLISNAFKFTPEGGRIVVSIEDTPEMVLIRVSDSGIGIAREDMDKIFDRFYQAENAFRTDSPGTGIGLALARSILDLHAGEIGVESQSDQGSCFTVSLRRGLSHFSKEQIDDAAHYDADSTCMAHMDEFDVSFVEELAYDKPRFTMLIVEDNRELCRMLRSVFDPLYKVYVAYDGEEGLAMTIRHQPDIVLSDLMMPRMSGSEMCSRIKGNFTVCHIPVVLLTAQTAVEFNLEGLKLGADDYITKPFDLKILIMRCNNLVNNRKVLQDKFSKSTRFPVRQLATNQLDQQFLERAYEVIGSHLDDPKFDVQLFSRELALGRSSLFRKIKGISGQTPNEFIVTVRLKKAVELFDTHPHLSISEISYQVGFTSAKYFGKCFKSHYGISPSEFRKNYN